MTTIVLTLLACIGFIGCASTPSQKITPPSPTQKALIGKTKNDLMSCIPVPPQERVVGDLTLLKYYKEASLLEESFPGTKSSVARIHHGCWATLMLKDDRVEGVQYESIPATYKDDEHCDEIFVQCVGQ